MRISFQTFLYTSLFLAIPFVSSYAQESKVYTYALVKEGDSKIIGFVSKNDTVKVSEKITSSSVANRKIVTANDGITIVWNKTKKKNELFSSTSELLAENGSTQKDFFNFTTTKGEPLTLVKIAKKEWSYMCKGQELVKIKVLNSKTVEITMIDGTQQESNLALMMSYAYASSIMDSGVINPIYIIASILLAVIRSTM